MARVKEALMDACEEVIAKAYDVEPALPIPFGYDAVDMFCDMIHDESEVPDCVAVIAKANDFFGKSWFKDAKGGA